MRVLRSKKVKAFFFFTLFIMTSVFAQYEIGVKAPPFKEPAFKTPHKLISFDVVPDLELDKAPWQIKTPIYSPHWKAKPFNSDLATDVLNVAAILNNFNPNNMPFFCRIEYQHEKAAKFPVKFRLGEVNYVDRLEQKVDWELGN